MYLYGQQLEVEIPKLYHKLKSPFPRNRLSKWQPSNSLPTLPIMVLEVTYIEMGSKSNAAIEIPENVSVVN